MNIIKSFCRQVRARSAGHQTATRLLSAADLPDQVVSILRQELDSIIRVIYLLSITDREYRQELIQSSVEGKQWAKKGTTSRITDREMVELAQNLQHWTKSVYRFGCAFIHLSSFHDYRKRDPMDMISNEEKQSILEHMRYYHGGPVTDDAKFSDLVPYLPRVFEKIANNLECYLKQLERNEDLEN